MREILRRIAEACHDTPTVCIGGINESNIQRVLYQCAASEKILNGVAIVSAIMAASDPEAAAKNLVSLSEAPPSFSVDTGRELSADASSEAVVALAPSVIQKIHDTTPLSHNMTNIVSVLGYGV